MHSYQITRAEYKTEPDRMKMKDLIRLFIEYCMPKRITYHNRGDFFWAKQTNRKKEECNFDTISTKELLISRCMTSITDKKEQVKKIKNSEIEKNNGNHQTEHV